MLEVLTIHASPRKPCIITKRTEDRLTPLISRSGRWAPNCRKIMVQERHACEHRQGSRRERHSCAAQSQMAAVHYRCKNLMLFCIRYTLLLQI